MTKNLLIQQTPTFYDSSVGSCQKKTIISYDCEKVINNWVEDFIDKTVEGHPGSTDSIGTIIGVGNDFQNQRGCQMALFWGEG